MRTGQPKSLAEVLLNLEPAQLPVRPAELVAESPQAHTEPPETPATEEQDGNANAAERGAASPAEASVCTPLNGDLIAAPPVKDGAPGGQVWLGAPEIGSVDVLAAARNDAPPRRARRIGRVLAVSAVALGLLSLGFVLGVNLDRSDTDVSTRSNASAEAERAPTPSVSSVEQTGSVGPGGPRSALVGVPEVIDGATLRLEGNVVRLYGVEWTTGGKGDALGRYIGGRVVRCTPFLTTTYQCEVEQRDLSEVVIFNGGARASPDAPQDLREAEGHARDRKLGVWKG